MSTATAALIPNHLVSPRDLARILGVPYSTVRYLHYHGKLPQPVRIGRHLRWRPDQVRELLGMQISTASGAEA
jgi:predicted DNA-binding transcriptional regulator AlpA